MSDLNLRADLEREAAIEATHFDRVYKKSGEVARRRNYIVPEEHINKALRQSKFKIDEYEYAYSLLGDMRNKKLLDYGAGDGWHAVCFAKADAKVWAIDISQESVGLIEATARANGVGNLIIAEVRNAYATGFDDNMFDLIYGGGILHHMDIEVAANEIRRILKPEGTAVFFEPIRQTGIMDFVKKIVLRVLKRDKAEETENETPLTIERLNLLKSSFGEMNFRFYNVLGSANKLIKSAGIRKTLLWADYIFMRIIPGYSKLARLVIIELRAPIK